MSTILLVGASALCTALGVLIALYAKVERGRAVLIAAMLALLAAFGAALATALAPWATLAMFICIGFACGLAGPLTFGRTPVGVLASCAATLFATWAALWGLFALACAFWERCV